MNLRSHESSRHTGCVSPAVTEATALRKRTSSVRGTTTRPPVTPRRSSSIAASKLASQCVGALGFGYGGRRRRGPAAMPSRAASSASRSAGSARRVATSKRRVPLQTGLCSGERERHSSGASGQAACRRSGAGSATSIRKERRSHVCTSARPASVSQSAASAAFSADTSAAAIAQDGAAISAATWTEIAEIPRMLAGSTCRSSLDVLVIG